MCPFGPKMTFLGDEIEKKTLRAGVFKKWRGEVKDAGSNKTPPRKAI